MRKKNYIFTNKKHSDKAIMSTILGVISLVSLGIVTYLSYSQGGVMHGGYGVTGVLATVYSLIGLILGVLTLRDKDIYRFFPVPGSGVTTLERIFYNSSEVFTADRGYQTVPGAGETGHSHTGRITAAQSCPV